jgi:phosphotransferase system  glucose/maltose/N-acetylglucosamine-specific IIC component
MMEINKPKPGMRYYGLAILAFVIASFAVQAMSHFVLNAGHYATVEFMRDEPIMALGIFTMIVQGAILAYLYTFFYRDGAPLLRGLKYGLLMGVFLGSYLTLVEPAKYIVPSIRSWMIVEGLASLVQFALYGILLGLIYDKFHKAA